MQAVHIHSQYNTQKEQILKLVDEFERSSERVIKDERNVIKSVYLNDELLNIKSFKTPNFFNAFIYKFIRKSKAKRSFEYAKKLIECNIKTPKPIAFIENFSALGLKESYYITQHLGYDYDFRKLIHKPLFKDRENILRQFTEFSYNLHENNINFLDHSPGNTLIIEKENLQYDFYLIDLNRMKFEAMNFNKRMHNFRRLWLSKTMIRIMSKAYAELYQKTYEETHDLMLKHSRSFQKKIDSKKLRRSKRKLKFKA